MMRRDRMGWRMDGQDLLRGVDILEKGFGWMGGRYGERRGKEREGKGRKGKQRKGKEKKGRVVGGCGAGKVKSRSVTNVI